MSVLALFAAHGAGHGGDLSVIFILLVAAAFLAAIVLAVRGAWVAALVAVAIAVVVLTVT